MSKVNPELRAKLKAAGKWDAFVDLRDKLRKPGVPQTAEDHERIAFLVLGNPNGVPPPSPVTAGEETASAPDYDLTEVSSRRATPSEMFTWIARALAMPTTDPSDCPDPMAWRLLGICRDDPDFEKEFLKDGFMKMLAGKAVEPEAATDENFDGKNQYDLLGKIAAVEGKEAEDD